MHVHKSSTLSWSSQFLSSILSINIEGSNKPLLIHLTYFDCQVTIDGIEGFDLTDPCLSLRALGFLQSSGREFSLRKNNEGNPGYTVVHWKEVM